MRISISPTRLQLSNPTKSNRVLGKRRNLLGYIEVATLKRKWEAGEVNQVRISHPPYICELTNECFCFWFVGLTGRTDA